MVYRSRGFFVPVCRFGRVVEFNYVRRTRFMQAGEEEAEQFFQAHNLDFKPVGSLRRLLTLRFGLHEYPRHVSWLQVPFEDLDSEVIKEELQQLYERNYNQAYYRVRGCDCWPVLRRVWALACHAVK